MFKIKKKKLKSVKSKMLNLDQDTRKVIKLQSKNLFVHRNIVASKYMCCIVGCKISLKLYEHSLLTIYIQIGGDQSDYFKSERKLQSRKRFLWYNTHVYDIFEGATPLVSMCVCV